MLLDSPQSWKLYSLELVERKELTDAVILRAIATPENTDCVFDYPEDAEYNLSECVGFNAASKKLEWGGSEFQLAAGVKEVTIDELCHERHLFVTFEEGATFEKETTLALNLDDHLGPVEYYHEQDGEFRNKLGKTPEKSKRSIILCFDGTSNHFSNQNTNVVKLVELLKKDNPEQQMVYYQAGVGTYSAPGFLTGVGQKVAARADEGIAWYLYQHVIDGYRYLMETYRAGDQISIFGFSRGAYTARALAGMLHSVGLLPRHNLEQVPFAYQVYSESEVDIESGDASKSTTKAKAESSDEYSDSPKDVDPRAFKRTYCIPVTITFLGVWDTVGSVGAFTRKTLPYIEHNPSVKYFRQALALDENRGNFIPSLWDHSETFKQNSTTSKQSAVEVWFKGGHCDVGGGAGPTEKFIPLDGPPQKPKARLSNISLRWMIRQCLEPGVHIFFDPKMMRHYRKHQILEKRPPGASKTDIQKEIDRLDARDIAQAPSLMYDSGGWKGFGWRMLDKVPVPKLSQITKAGEQPETTWRPNNGAPRIIHLADPRSNIRLHASVYAHLEHPDEAKEKEPYKPAAIWDNWKVGHWPILEEGECKSVTVSGLDETPFRRAINMSWKPKPEEKSWSETISGWFKWS
ncbi:hypothetical protein RhiXN_11204 [Rhizoctonia solani]|uniref:T6SS Phospholipase effector Tle1-like catalytic domain-containing protein n=1 Tax=Rhizoctonia solani TaxID=456999 RepID=A0A8H8T2S5_9AGAM|nr:uncharacterized protein RhiXN_11204 [Rhizoctonia solani]QRW26127.1 hypothetical protein RhiXN_11204 [Rhizoctonia solani]